MPRRHRGMESLRESIEFLRNPKGSQGSRAAFERAFFGEKRAPPLPAEGGGRVPGESAISPFRDPRDPFEFLRNSNEFQRIPRPRRRRGLEFLWHSYGIQWIP